MSPVERKQALSEFRRLLAPNGLIILTVDYPFVTPEELLKSAYEAGLESAGAKELGKPCQGSISYGGLSVYRAVLRAIPQFPG